MHFIILSTLASIASAMPSFIAVPSDQIAFVDLSAFRVRRVPRQTLAPPPPQLPQLPQALYQDDYLPIPIEQYPQQTVALAPPPQQERRIVVAPVQELPQDANPAASQFEVRPPDFGEYVDFGAHTGDQGAFGWYADFPIDNHHDSGYRK